MDKNTVIGLILIIGIFAGFSWLNKPSKEQLEARKRYQDSIAQVQLHAQQQAAETQKLLSEQKNQEADNDSIIAAKSGLFANVVKGDTALVEVETDLLKLQFSHKGGSLYSAELKNYRTHDSLPLVLFNGKEENLLAFIFNTIDNRVFSSEDLFFKPQEIVEDSTSKRLVFRLEMSDTSFMDFVYTIQKNSYVIDFDIVANKMLSYFYPMTDALEMIWKNKISQQEKGRKFEGNYSTLNYRFANSDMEKLSAAKNDAKIIQTPVQWIAAKDQFFSAVLLAKQGFPTAKLTSEAFGENSKYLKNFTVNSSV
ncbi:MAG: membrane protein insertase YidC, partial [Prevotellaceae bacterium]|nr:membrane protein insertase YidC [Prevotellaceae bacterium]